MLFENYQQSTQELFCYKKVYSFICRLNENSWQECQLWNQTFDEKLGEVDVAEMRQLMDESDENENHSIESRDTFK
jgi:hypothetical protein